MKVKKRGFTSIKLVFNPTSKKATIAIGATTGEFVVENAATGEAVFEGELSEPREASFSDYSAQTADFSELAEPGSYVVKVEGMESYPFDIKNKVLEEVTKASIKGFYFQRMSAELPEQYAGKWARKAGHPDTAVYVHPSAATKERPEGTVIAASKGWYDAGDYNKYIVNSGITMGTMLSAYEDFPDYYRQLELSIPESGNEVPDLLEEVLWNLRWMLTMQDTDGGVYHKLTTANFEGMVMPENATNKRWVVQKGTGATLDFAAVTAQASRVFRQFESQLPGLADSCLAASKRRGSGHRIIGRCFTGRRK